jgi:hypothetical protein
MNKLYVLIREDLVPAQQAVQAGHAVAEYLLKKPDHKWENGTLVYLGVPNEEKLKRWKCKLEAFNIPFVVFKEPDLNNEVTAIATITTTEIFKSLPLA